MDSTVAKTNGTENEHRDLDPFEKFLTDPEVRRLHLEIKERKKRERIFYGLVLALIVLVSVNLGLMIYLVGRV